jgi:TRAP-type mannitol/chloroaromatic compound transport system substrate-binding protein
LVFIKQQNTTIIQDGMSQDQCLELLINIDAWNSLPKHLQVIIETATKAVNQDTLDEYLARNNQALTELN